VVSLSVSLVIALPLVVSLSLSLSLVVSLSLSLSLVVSLSLSLSLLWSLYLSLSRVVSLCFSCGLCLSFSCDLSLSRVFLSLSLSLSLFRGRLPVSLSLSLSLSLCSRAYPCCLMSSLSVHLCLIPLVTVLCLVLMFKRKIHHDGPEVVVHCATCHALECGGGTQSMRWSSITVEDQSFLTCRSCVNNISRGFASAALDPNVGVRIVQRTKWSPDNSILEVTKTQVSETIITYHHGVETRRLYQQSQHVASMFLPDPTTAPSEGRTNVLVYALERIREAAAQAPDVVADILVDATRGASLTTSVAANTILCTYGGRVPLLQDTVAPFTDQALQVLTFTDKRHRELHLLGNQHWSQSILHRNGAPNVRFNACGQVVTLHAIHGTTTHPVQLYATYPLARFTIRLGGYAWTTLTATELRAFAARLLILVPDDLQTLSANDRQQYDLFWRDWQDKRLALHRQALDVLLTEATNAAETAQLASTAATDLVTVATSAALAAQAVVLASTMKVLAIELAVHQLASV
jgi:hypothetical protein